MSKRQTIGMRVDLFGGDVERPTLVISNPFRGQRLAVPRDVRLGDTPAGEPAILWKVPSRKSRDIQSPDYARVNWAAGASTDLAVWAFLELATESDSERFVDFARRFGPLGLWPYRTGQVNEKGQEIQIFELTDGQGRDIWVPSIADGIQTPFRYEGPINGSDYRYLNENGLHSMLYEPISEWRRWAGWLGAVLDISQALRLEDVGTQEQWAVIGIGPDLYAKFKYARDPKRQRRELASFIQFWFLKWSGLTPVLRWTGEHPSFELAFGGDHAVKIRRASMQHDWPENSLFPALVGSLLAIVLAGRPVASCAKCGKIHPRMRKPRSDQPAYCPFCQPEAIRENKRRSAARTRAKKRESQVSAITETRLASP
jgi:hypothetical protein